MIPYQHANSMKGRHRVGDMEWAIPDLAGLQTRIFFHEITPDEKTGEWPEFASLEEVSQSQLKYLQSLPKKRGLKKQDYIIILNQNL